MDNDDLKKVIDGILISDRKVNPAPPIRMQCTDCKHLIPRTITCKAFPNLIPLEIRQNKWDHRRPFEGDQGIQFEEKTKENEAK